MKRLLPSLLLISLLLAGCNATGRKTYASPYYSFTYPAGWKTMAEISPEYQSGKNYYWLGVDEEATITSARKAGQAGLYFSVASKDGMFTPGLETFPTWTYAIVEEELRELNMAPAVLSGSAGKMYHYNRLWDENWVQFQDYWIGDGLTLYLLSFRAQDLSPYQKEISEIVESFAFIK